MASQKYKGQYTGVRFMLDRTGYESKEKLIESINIAEKQLETGIYDVEYVPGAYSTQFSYDLTKPFPKVDAITTVIEGLKNIDELLPFTLIFMRKVKQVEIINHAFPSFEYGKRTVFKRDEQSATLINYRQFDEKDQLCKNVDHQFKVIQQEDATVVVRTDGKKILPYPPLITKLFCSLPMIGSEKFCLPYILNSAKFIPATERHKVELSENDQPNRKILLDSIIAFKALINNLIDEGCYDFHHLCIFSDPNDASPAVNTWLRDFVLKPIQNALNDLQIVIANAPGVSIKLSDASIAYIPREEFNATRFSELTMITDTLQKSKAPKKDDVILWYNSLDFSRFPNQKFTIETILKKIHDAAKLSVLNTLLGVSCTSWLSDVHQYVLAYHETFLDQYKLIPDQEGNLHFRKDNINWDDQIPKDLKEIYLKITGNSYGHILLDTDFETNLALLPAIQVKGAKDIGVEIDLAFKNYNGDTGDKNYLEALRKLFKWFKDHKDDEDESLNKTFEYFSKKKPQLFMDTFNEEEKDKAFVIVQSGKLQSLAKLAESRISDEEIDLLTNNLDQVKRILQWLSQKTDDETHANKNTGYTGEEIVFEELNKKFSSFNNAQVIWASRDRQEPCYDFEVIRDGEIILYVDAKTTNQGIANSDSIPFFVRRKQWEFLKDESVRNKYIVARVTTGSGNIGIEWLSLNLGNL